MKRCRPDLWARVGGEDRKSRSRGYEALRVLAKELKVEPNKLDIVEYLRVVNVELQNGCET